MVPLLTLTCVYRGIAITIKTNMQKSTAEFTMNGITHFSGEFVVIDNAVGWALFKINDLLQGKKA